MAGPIWNFAVSMLVGVGVASEISLTLWTATSLLMISWGLLARLRWMRTVILVGFCFGLWVVALQPSGPTLRGELVVQGVIAAPPMGREADVSVGRWRVLDGEWASVSGRIRVRFCEPPPSLGTPVSVFGRAEKPTRSVLPGAPDPIRALRRAKINTHLHCMEMAAPPPPPLALDLDDGTHVGILLALATGNRSAVSKDTWSLLRRTGTAHLLAISGFHIGLVAWFGYLMGQFLARFYVFYDECGAHPAFALGLSALTAWSYALGAGLPVSAQRAAMMVTLMVITKALDRQLPVGNLLGIAGIAVMCFDPSAVSSPGFQLSFMAVVGLVRVSPWVVAVLGNPSGLLGWGVKGLSATIGATVGTLPVAAWWFQEIAPYSPLANLVALPWVAWVVVPCAFGAVWLPQPLSGWALSGGEWGMSTLVSTLSMMDAAPFVLAIGPGLCLTGVVLCLLPARFSLMALFLAQLSLSAPRVGMTLTMLDVGHGDSIVVQWPDGQVWLVDGGPPSRSVMQYLRRQGIGRVDVVVLTHGHLDHAGGLWAVVEQLEIGQIWFGRSWDERVFLTAAERGIEIVLDPDTALSMNRQSRSDNDRSLVLPIQSGPFSVLLTGDIGAKREASLGSLGRVDVLKVAHHGSATSSSERMLDQLKPAIALISTSGAYGLPHPDVLERYRKRGIVVLRTDTLGTISLRFEDTGLTGWHHRAGEGWQSLDLGELEAAGPG